MYSRMPITKSIKDYSEEIGKLKDEIQKADAIVIGAGAGLSTSAGFDYTGERFRKYFGDFAEKYGFQDMYAGGFYPYDTLEEYWAYWSRYIYINRYSKALKPVYEDLFGLVRNRDYFVLTTNVDHCFQKAGFDKQRLFYTQGDYGLFQCSKPCHEINYDNEEIIERMMRAQGYLISEQNPPKLPEKTKPVMTIPSDLVPYCPRCKRPMSMNLRSDDTFVEDDGWRAAAKRYRQFLEKVSGGKVLFLELGVGYNTPGIIKYPFWQMTAENQEATYACINSKEAFCPKEIEKQAICINADIGEVLKTLFSQRQHENE